MRNRFAPLARTLILPVIALLVALACGTAITDTAYYTCPTAIPPPTEPPPVVLPSAPITIPTLPPFPTAVPTVYSISAPDDFHTGDAVFVGPSGAPDRLRFRLYGVEKINDGSQTLVSWWLEIANLGGLVYETVPPALMIITRIDEGYDVQDGIWRTSEAAMQAAGITDADYSPLAPGETRYYRLAAHIPPGEVIQFAYLLDGDGGNRITWANASNPYCAGDVAD